jgi:hypothetical protein
MFSVNRNWKRMLTAESRLAHLLMLVLRAVAIFKAGFSSQASKGANGGLSSGELSFQFSIKFLRQQNTTTGQANHSTATAGSEVA